MDLAAAYHGKRVVVTGHTGFKGAWLTAWLHKLGAQVTGLSLAPEYADGLFTAAKLERRCRHHVLDIRDADALKKAIADARPDFVFHLAAQALVRRSYAQPLETVAVNVLGTANVLEAVRAYGHRCTVIVVTSDKAYENREWPWGYRENDAMGGHDVYSMSKGACELLVSSWRRSFFSGQSPVRLASARAGNVIGGGDASVDRIIPDCIKALREGKPIAVRNPKSVRPWQHVLEPLNGYLELAAQLDAASPAQLPTLADGWNFGPREDASRPVKQLVEAMIARWGSGSWVDHSDPKALHEAGRLTLSIDKAMLHLNWQPRWGFAETVEKTTAWYRAQADHATPEQIEALTLAQISAYEAQSPT